MVGARGVSKFFTSFFCVVILLEDGKCFIPFITSAIFKLLATKVDLIFPFLFKF